MFEFCQWQVGKCHWQKDIISCYLQVHPQFTQTDYSPEKKPVWEWKSKMSRADKVIIVGAGLAGLCCALKLKSAGIPFQILEASDSVGGRVKTDVLDGFLLDRGFQIMLTAYPEASKILDYRKLDMKPFFPGALVRAKGKFHHVADPVREPMYAFETLMAPIGSMVDKLRVAGLRNRLLSDRSSTATIESKTTLDDLRESGFSERMIQQFFRPFLGGIFLDKTLETSASMFDFVFEMLARGDNAIPAAGMQAIPKQIASCLPPDSIKLNCPVARVDGNDLLLASGETISGLCVVLATEQPQCDSLLGRRSSPRFRSQTCVYFAASRAPFDEPVLVLNGEDDGIVTNLTVPSNLSANFAPDGRALISAVVIGDAPMSDFVLQEAIRNQMRQWYGSQVSQWQHLRTYRIKYALPDQSPGALSSIDRNYRCGTSVYFCGDYKETASINGAMVSGRKAAEAILADLAVSVPGGSQASAG